MSKRPKYLKNWSCKGEKIFEMHRSETQKTASECKSVKKERNTVIGLTMLVAVCDFVQSLILYT